MLQGRKMQAPHSLLLNLNDARQRLRTPTEIYLDERVGEAARRLFEATDAVAIILFGSRVRGTARPWSDWDLCVILPDETDVTNFTPFRLRPLTSDLGVPIDVVTMRLRIFKDSVDRPDSLSHEIARDGAVILRG